MVKGCWPKKTIVNTAQDRRIVCDSQKKKKEELCRVNRHRSEIPNLGRNETLARSCLRGSRVVIAVASVSPPRSGSRLRRDPIPSLDAPPGTGVALPRPSQLSVPSASSSPFRLRPSPTSAALRAASSPSWLGRSPPAAVQIRSGAPPRPRPWLLLVPAVLYSQLATTTATSGSRRHLLLVHDFSDGASCRCYLAGDCRRRRLRLGAELVDDALTSVVAAVLRGQHLRTQLAVCGCASAGAGLAYAAGRPRTRSTATLAMPIAVKFQHRRDFYDFFLLEVHWDSTVDREPIDCGGDDGFNFFLKHSSFVAGCC